MRNVRSEALRLGSLLVLVALVACGRSAAPTDASPDPALQALTASDLFVSEYVEGSGLNKALEIYNGTGASIDLAAGDYNVQIYSNGDGTGGFTTGLTGTLEDGDVFVLAQSGADRTVLDVADATTGDGLFNGNDVVVLRKGTTALDVIGQVGVATEWGDGDASTENNTLRRKPAVCEGDTDASDPFDPSTEWDGFGVDAFDGLGSHTATCTGGEAGGDSGPAEAPLVLNEVDYDQPSTDAAEFVELKNVTEEAVSLLGYTVELVNGNGGSVYGSFDLPDVTLAPGGYFVICGNVATVANCDLDVSPDTNLVQNGDPDAVILIRDGIVIDALTYEGELGEPYTEGSGASVVDGSDGGLGLSRHPDGADTDRNETDFALCPITPGAANACGDEDAGGEPVVVGQCGESATLVSAVQGDGATSPLEGERVVVEGVVVGDFQEDDGDAFGTDLDGFYLQEEEADRDGDDATSEGVFVYAPGAADVVPGQVVRVAGTVTEYDGLTELTDVEIVDCGTTAQPAITEITLPVEPRDALERYEGMLVRFPQELVIAEYFNFDRFGEIVLALPTGDLDRPFQPTSYVEPGPEAEELTEEIEVRRITLDDGRSMQNPHPARHPNGEPFTLDNRFRGGDLVANATGILDDRFGRYRIQPTQGADHVPVNERPAEPADVGGELRAASFNVLNYFTTLGSRGADTPEEFERQRAKIVAALEAIDADVVGLIEIENRSEALQDLVAALNDAMGEGTYAAIETGPVGEDEIRVALVYKPDAVTPVGDAAVLDTPAFLDPAGTGTDRNRPALAQTFAQNADGAVFTVVVNHLKSKGSGCGEGDDDPLQGNCNLTRTLAAAELLSWIEDDPTGVDDPDYLLLGDYNAYDEEDPIDVLLDGGLVDLLEEHEGEFAYSYVFDGQFGHLDYAFATETLAEQVTGATAWHINADEPDVLDYDTSFKPDEQAEALYEPSPYRSSDHDPIVVGLDLETTHVCEAAEASPASLWPANHAFVEVSVLGGDGAALDVAVHSVAQDEPVLGRGSGDTAPDAVLHESGRVELRAERDGAGDGRVYHLVFTATDGVQSCAGEVVASVPSNRGRGGAAVDGGALHDSTVR